MKIVKTETETAIYPLLSENSVEQEEDYCIAVDRKDTAIVDGYMWDEDEIQSVINGLEKALEVMRAF
jgi:hypothetical protein